MPDFTSYFTLFDLPMGYDIDPAVLERAYFARQRELHPDKAMSQQTRDQHAATQQSATLNRAYQTLKHPLKRAIHLLKHYGVDMEQSPEQHKLGMELLEAMMEQREALADITDEAERLAAGTEVMQAIHATQRQLATAFETLARTTTEQERSKLLAQLIQQILNLQFLEKQHSEISKNT